MKDSNNLYHQSLKKEENFMRKEIWMHTQTNLSESLEKQEYTTLIQYASDNKEYVINEWYNSDNSSLSQILRYGNSQLNYLNITYQRHQKRMLFFN